MADGPSSCHKLLDNVEHWLLWSGMQAKIPKCHSLAIHATSGKTYDPMLTLHGNSIPDIDIGLTFKLHLNSTRPQQDEGPSYEQTEFSTEQG